MQFDPGLEYRPARKSGAAGTGTGIGAGAGTGVTGGGGTNKDDNS